MVRAPNGIIYVRRKVWIGTIRGLHCAKHGFAHCAGNPRIACAKYGSGDCTAQSMDCIIFYARSMDLSGQSMQVSTAHE